jgi:PTS system nitrogen regulatory IIA component
VKIMDILVQDGVILDLSSSSKEAVLGEMATAMASAEASLSSDKLLEVLVAREGLQSTGIGDGVAIPHGKIAGLDRLVASFARSVKGIDFDSIDDQPTHLFFLLVVPEASSGLHLQALARISRFFRDIEFRDKLMSASSLDDVLRAIDEEDAKF